VFIQFENKQDCYHPGICQQTMNGNPMKRIGLLAMLALASCAMNTHDKIDKLIDDGSIAGVIQYPGHVVPALRICALNPQTQAAVCIKTSAGQSKYQIKNLPAADYQIIASIEQWQFKTGAHVMQVQCIRAPCLAMLKTVSLQAGQALDKIDLNGFYEIGRAHV